MATYNYLVGTKQGKTLKGGIEADDRYHAVDQLRKKGYFVLDLKKTSQIGPFDLDKIKQKIESYFGAEMGASERVMFTHHLASMLKTGVPVIEAVGIFAEQKGNSRRRHMFKQIIGDVEGGMPLSQAFARFPKTFSPIYTQIISSGESMGTLGETLEYLAQQLRRDHELISQVRSAMFYPIIVITIMVFVLGFITFSVIPKLLVFAQNMETDLPITTRLLISLTSFVTDYWLYLSVGIVVTAFLFVRFLKTDIGKKRFDQLLFFFPIIKSLTQHFNLARFSRLLGAFYHYGIPVTTAFSILKTSLPNTYYQNAVDRLKDKLSRGLALSDALDEEKDKLFPRIMGRVIKSAEKSATVDDALWRLADYYEEELNGSLKNLIKIIEPVLMLILGMAVVGLALAVIVPIYQITAQFK